MFALDPMSWAAADDATDPWHNLHPIDHLDALVLHEARIATDFRQFAAPARGASLIERIRQVITGGVPAATPDACVCLA